MTCLALIFGALKYILYFYYISCYLFTIFLLLIFHVILINPRSRFTEFSEYRTRHFLQRVWLNEAVVFFDRALEIRSRVLQQNVCSSGFNFWWCVWEHEKVWFSCLTYTWVFPGTLVYSAKQPQSRQHPSHRARLSWITGTSVHN